MAENYILVAGKGAVASFENHLARYLIQAKDYKAGPILPDGRFGEALKAEWRSLWSEGKRLEGDRQPKDCAYRVQPLGKHKDKPRLDFAFCDVSAAAFDADKEEAPPALADGLTALVGDPKLNFVLILLCERDKAGQDERLGGLLAALKSACGAEFASRCPVLLLVVKARGAKASEGVEAFMAANLSATLAALEDWQARYTLGELDMGDFELAEDGELVLDAPKFEDAARIFRWIYFQFTRYPVVEPFLARLWKSVRKSPF